LDGTGLYIHIPFCVQRCPYCAFFSTVRGSADRAGYVEAVIREMERRAQEKTWGPVSTVYLGGGTPSLLSSHQVGRLLQAARDVLGVRKGAEITLEANPGTMDAMALAGYREAGIDRLSLGAQSFHEDTLKTLGRIHTARQARDSFKDARRAGFENISVDLILGVPREESRSWKETIEIAIHLAPEHLSVYALTVEQGTRWEEEVLSGKRERQSEEEQACLWRQGAQVLLGAGYLHYEVSNYSLPGRQSRHNQGYWTGNPYLGVGASAHRFDGRERAWNVSDLDDYMGQVQQGEDPTEDRERLDDSTLEFERLFLGLRTSTGISLSKEQRVRFKASDPGQALLKEGFLEETMVGVAPTEEGLLRADAMALEVAEVLLCSSGPGETIHATLASPL